MRKYLICLMFLSTVVLEAKTLKIAVIDTGINTYSGVKLCKNLSKDFTGTGMRDRHLHGEYVSKIIAKQATGDHCQIIIKWIDPKINVSYMTEAINYAVDVGADIINISGGGTFPYESEREAIMRALNKKIVIVAASGNDRCHLGYRCTYYPAMYDKRIIVVGSSNKRRGIASYSNWGDGVIYAPGDIRSFGIDKRGTSFSAPYVTGKIIRLVDKKKYGRSK